MKFALFIGVVLCFVFGLPFRDLDTQKLIPVQAVQVVRWEQGIRLISDVGEGEGNTWNEAVEDLRRKASGHVFLDTVEHVVFCGRGRVTEVLSGGQLRPAAQVYFSEKPLEREDLAEYLAAHPAPMTLADLQAIMVSQGSAGR